MATYTITTPVNIDSLASKVGSDTYNINGGYLTVDQHTRYGTNANTSAAMGNIVLSATLGGTIEFTTANVRLVPYTGGGGSVGSIMGATLNCTGGGSGVVIGIYDDLSTAPKTGGSASGTGLVLIKQWNGVAFPNGGTLSGAMTGTVSGGDRQGFIEIVGVDALGCTVNRLNTFKVRGGWFDFLGVTTTGANTGTYQAPANGSIFYAAGVEVETGVGTGVYEFYPCVGSQTALLANIGTEADRGKVCWISTAGVVRFGHDGTNTTGGYVPVSGCKLRMPSVLFHCCTAAALTVNVLPNATLATRYDFSTTGGGVIDIQGASMNWYPIFAQPFSVALSNSFFLTQLNVSEIASPIAWSHVGVGQEAANAQTGLVMATCLAGGTMADCTWTSATLASSGRYVVSLTDVKGLTITNEKIHAFAARGNATSGASTLIRVSDSSWDNLRVIGGRVLMTTCTNLTFTDTVYADLPSLTTSTSNPMYTFDMGTACQNIKMDGVTVPVPRNPPYNGFLSVGAAGCTNIVLRNIGAPATPVDLGFPMIDALSWTRTTTVATLTQTAHGMRVGDSFYVVVSSSTAAITVGLKTVASVVDANRITFTCLNAGAASGTLSHYQTITGSIAVLASTAVADTVKVQRVYATRTRGVLATMDNSSKNVLIQNVAADYLGAQVFPALNMTVRGLWAAPVGTAQTAVYGTHFFDAFTTSELTNRAALAWTRSTTTATVTSNAHGLRNNDIVVVTITSDAAAIVLGQKTITVLTANTFTFTCLNAGATSGTLTAVPINGRIGLVMNEPTANTVGQYTVDSGTPAFTSTGGLYMPVVNQQVTFEMPGYVLGHYLFAIAEAIMGGGTITNYDITYALDAGAGYGSFHNLSYPRAGGGGTNGSTNVTMTSTTGVEVGDYVFGTNIGPLARVSSITNGTTIVVDTANIGTVSGTLRFNHLPYESGSDANGWRMKIRIKTTTTNATAITSLYMGTISDNTTRAYEYVLDTADLVIPGLLAGTDVVVLDAGTNTILASADSITGTFTWTYDPDTVSSVDIAIYKPGYKMIPYKAIPLTSAGLTLPAVSQQFDAAYA